MWASLPDSISKTETALSLDSECTHFSAALQRQAEKKRCVHKSLLGLPALTSVIVKMSHMEGSRKSVKITMRAGVRVLILKGLFFLLHTVLFG